MGSAVNSINSQGQLVHGAASGAGTAGSGGFADGIAPVLPTAVTLFNNVVSAITAAKIPLNVAARLAGEVIGMNFDGGIAQGIRDYIPGIELAAREAVTRAQAAARSQAQARSPSLVFARIGADMGRGMAAGLLDSRAEVEEAGKRLAAAAVSPIPGIASPATAIVSAADAARAAASVVKTSQAGGDVSASVAASLFRDLIVEVDARGGMTEAQGRRVGSSVGGAVLDRLSPLAARRLIVDTKVS
jgi:hypothetical protein